MGITNKWLSPYQRSYQQIKTKLIDSLRTIKDSNGNTLITDYSEGNILVLILSLFAAIAEVLHYYIDNMARESFLVTARRYDSVIKHGKLVDYYPRGAIASTVDVVLTRPLTSSTINAELTIPKGTVFTDSDGNTWEVSKNTKWYKNVTTCTVPLIQHELYTSSGLVGTVIPTGDKVKIKLGTLPGGKYYEQGSMELAIGGTSWVGVTTFAYSKSTDKHFMVVLNDSQEPVIVFGDGTFGMKPAAGSKITKGQFYITTGATGNIDSNSLVQTPALITASITDASCSNPYSAGGGSNYESFGMLKEHIPLSVKTLGVAITKQDFVDLAKLVDGVNQAAVDYECGRKLTIYISPDNGGVASTELINRVQTNLSQHAPITTWLRVKSSGIAKIILQMEVTGNKSYRSTEIHNQVLNALYNSYSRENSKIGGNVRLSDIYALIDGLPSVDYLHITKFYIKPWPKTIYGNKELLLGQFDLDKATGSMTYYIIFESDITYMVRSLSGGFIVSGCVVGTKSVIADTVNGFNFTLDVQNNGYVSGYRYSLTISEPNFDYEDPGYNLPIFEDESDLTLTIKETL